MERIGLRRKCRSFPCPSGQPHTSCRGSLHPILEKNIGLIFTLGGNGSGPRDITLSSLEPFFDYRLEGIEQTMHSLAQVNHNGIYIDRLAAGKIGKSIVICLPLNSNLATDALNVLVPNIHQAFEF